MRWIRCRSAATKPRLPACSPAVMSPNEPSTVPLTRRSAAWLVLLLIAGVAGNRFSAPLFLGVDFLFGSIFTLILVARYGTAVGVVAAVVISSYTYFLWNHPWAILIFACEALVVGLLHHRWRQNLLLSTGIFWLIFGMPLVWLLYGGVMQMSANPTMLIMLKQSVNGIFNAFIASLLLLAAARFLPAPTGRMHLSYQQLLFLLVSSLIFIPSLALTLFEGQRVIQRIEAEVAERLERNSASVSHQLRRWYSKHFLALEQLARSAAEDESPEVLEFRASTIQAVLPELDLILVAETDGTVVASSPATGPDGDALAGRSLGDEPYFGRARELLEQRTRALPNFPGDPTFQMVAVMRGDGSSGRIVIGLLRRSHVNVLLREIVYGRSLLAVLKSDGSPLIASSPEAADALREARRRTTIADGAPGVFLLAPENRNLPVMTQWNRSHYAQETLIESQSNTRLLVMMPVAPYQRLLYERYIYTLLLALALIYAAFLVAALISRSLARPITKLAAITGRLPQELDSPTEKLWPQSGLAEVAALISNFDTMTHALQRNFAELQRRSAELEREVAERERVEQSLRQRERELNGVVENAPDIIARFDRNYRHIFINSVIERFTLLRREDFIGKTSREAGLPSDLCDLWERKLQRAWQQRRQVEMDFAAPGPDGVTFFQSRLVPEINPEGEVVSILAITRDISTLKDAERLVIDQNRVLELLATGTGLDEVLAATIRMIEERLPGARCAVVLLENGSIRHSAGSASLPPEIVALIGEAASADAVRPTGLTVTEFARAPVGAELRAAAARASIGSCWSAAVCSSSGKPLGSFGCCHAEAGQPTFVQKKWVQGAAHMAGIAIEHARAMEALRQAEEDLRSYATALEQRVAERTMRLQESHQSLESFCYTIAHDLRAPLRAIQGFSATLSEEFGPSLSGDGDFYLKRIQRAAVRMDDLIKDLLDYGRLSHGDLPLESVSLDQVMSDVGYQLSADLLASNAVMDIAAPLASVRANALILEQLVANLVSNALKYVSPGTRPHIRIWSETGEKFVRLHVQDNGIGIAPEHHDRIFRVFERLQTESEYSGTGIGLAIVRKGAERMGGKVGVESRPGGGSCFWLELPKADPSGEIRDGRLVGSER